MKTLRNILLFLAFTTSLLAANNLKTIEGKSTMGIQKKQLKNGADIKVLDSFKDGDLKIILKTNLPTGMRLDLFLSGIDNNYKGMENWFIDNYQECEVNFKNIKKGKYTLLVRSPLAITQDYVVVKEIGEKGENIKGKFTKVTFGENLIDFKKIIVVK